MKITIEPEEGDKIERCSYEHVYEFALVGHHSFDRVPICMTNSICGGALRLIGKLEEAKEGIRRAVTIMDIKELIKEALPSNGDGSD